MKKTSEITPKTVLSQSKDQVSTDLDGETVLMSIEQGNYYGMDQILSFVSKKVIRLRHYLLSLVSCTDFHPLLWAKPMGIFENLRFTRAL